MESRGIIYNLWYKSWLGTKKALIFYFLQNLNLALTCSICLTVINFSICVCLSPFSPKSLVSFCMSHSDPDFCLLRLLWVYSTLRPSKAQVSQHTRSCSSIRLSCNTLTQRIAQWRKKVLWDKNKPPLNCYVLIDKEYTELQRLHLRHNRIQDAHYKILFHCTVPLSLVPQRRTAKSKSTFWT